MLAEAQSDHLVGVVLGGAYQLVGCIGQGGMGAVYEAHHLRLQKRVAVKLIKQAQAGNGEALARFHREASVASRLGHPNLVNVLDFGTSDHGEPYLVMEYLDGEDLDRRIHRAGPVPLAAAVQITRQVASALAVVHAKGIVHRDLKPANVFLVKVPGEPDFVKVLDFGVSKMKAARTKLTADSKMVGTPKYMSPEQASGLKGDVDHRTDQWALACIAWEMLSGAAPFNGEDIHELFFRVINLAPAPLSSLVPDISSAVEDVLLRALSKRPADRYPSIREFARAFQTAVLGSWAELTPMPVGCGQGAVPQGEASPSASISARAVENALGAITMPATKPRRSGLWLAMTGLTVGIAMGAGGLLLANARMSTSAQASIPRAEASPMVSAPAIIVSPAPAPQTRAAAPLAPKPGVRSRAKPQLRAPSSGALDDVTAVRGAKTKSASAAARDRQASLPRRERHIFEDL